MEARLCQLSSFIPTLYLSVADFEAFATDYLVFAHAYLEQIPSMETVLFMLVAGAIIRPHPDIARL